MSVRPGPRYPARLDDDLALDQPAPQNRRDWRDARESTQAHHVHDVVDERPIIVAAPAPRVTGLDAASRTLGLFLKLTLLLVMLAVLWGLVSFIDFSVRTPAAIGSQIGNALERGAAVAGATGQRVADAFDPAHPPREALAQDIEIDELLKLNVGAEVPGSATRTVTLASIQRRADPSGPDGAIYAVLHSELRSPQETKLVGVTVRSTRDPQDYYLYRGETIRVGHRLYKVNWVSMERQQVALVAYREQDRVAVPLKAQVD
ncbi:MAG: hypothetical protein AB7K36_31950 [Chloroflexota bacterium]